MTKKKIKLKLTLRTISETYTGDASSLLNEIKNAGLTLIKNVGGFNITCDVVGKLRGETETVQKLNELKLLKINDVNGIEIGLFSINFLEIDDNLYNIPDDADLEISTVEIKFISDDDEEGEESSALFSEYKSQMYERNLPIDYGSCVYCLARYDSTLSAYIPYIPYKLPSTDSEGGEGMWNVDVNSLGIDLFEPTWEWDSETGSGAFIPAKTKTLYYKQIQNENEELETVGYNNYFTPEYYHIGYKYKWKPIESYEIGVEIDYDYINEKEAEEDYEAVEEYKQNIIEQATEAIESIFTPSDYYIKVWFNINNNFNAQVLSKETEFMSQEELNEEGITESNQNYDYDESTNLNIGIQLVSVLPHSNKGNLIGILSPVYSESELLSKVLTLREIPVTQSVISVYQYPLSSVELDGINYQNAQYKNLLWGYMDDTTTISDIDLYIQNGTEEASAKVTKVDFLTGYSKSGWKNSGSYAKFEYDYFYNYCYLINDSSDISSVISVRPSNNTVYQDTLDNLILSRSFKDKLPELFYCKSMNPWLYYSSSQIEMKNIIQKYKTIYNSSLHGYVFGSSIMKTTPSNISRMYTFNIYFGGYYNSGSESSSYLKFIIYSVNKDNDDISSIRNVYCNTQEITNESLFSFTESSSYPYRFLFLESDENSDITNILALHDLPTASDDFDNTLDLENFLSVVLGKNPSIPYTTPEKEARVDYSILTDNGSNFTTVPYYYNQTVIEYPSIAIEKIGFFKNGSFVEIKDIIQPDTSSSLINIPKSSNPNLSINDKIFTVYKKISDY